MSKIICDICGTRYPDTADQCPICGHIREAAAKTAADDMFVMDEVQPEPREKVKGGRFSKENVKKRAEGAHRFEAAPASASRPAKKSRPSQEQKPVRKAEPAKAKKEEDIFAEDNQNKRANTILNILLVIVILALLAVTVYIFTQHILPELTKPEPTAAPTELVTEPTEPPVTEEPTYPCDELLLPETEVLLTEYDQKWLINVDVRPENTTDTLTFISSDDTIATVDAEGCVTAMAEGQCVITISCGTVEVEYNVICLFPGVDIQPGYVPTDPPPTDPPVEMIVTTDYVNVRKGTNTDYDKVRQCFKGDKIYVYEIKMVKDVPWGRLEDGWICLKYAKESN